MSFSDPLLSVCPSVHLSVNFSIFSSFYQEPQGQFQTNLAQSIHGWWGLNFFQIKGHAPRGDNNEIVKIYWQTLKIIFSRTKLSAKHPRVMRIELWLNKNYSVFKEKIISFFSFNQHCGLILSCAKVFIDWNWFSGERCGTWASCSILSDKFRV